MKNVIYMLHMGGIFQYHGSMAGGGRKKNVKIGIPTDVLLLSQILCTFHK